jgi:hypothetical protein
MSEGSVLHQLCKLFKEIATVMRSWSSLRVVLHAESWRIENAHSFIGLIVEVEVRHCYSPTQTFGVNTEVVILTGDFDVTRSQMLHWMISETIIN